MEALISSRFSPFPSFPSPPCSRRHPPKRCSRFVPRLAHGSDDATGRKVDEDMIVLRLRIHEMRAMERNHEPPSHWMEWEKRCFSSYAADVCMAVGLLQTLLMSTRPSLAVALVLTFALSVPASGFLLLCHLQGMLGFVLSGVQTIIKGILIK